MTGTDVQALREPSYTVPVHDAVCDQSHRPGDEIVSYVPFRRAGARIRPATLARSEPCALSCRSRSIETHVGSLGSDRRTARAAVDAGRGHTGDEDPVPPGIAGRYRPV